VTLTILQKMQVWLVRAFIAPLWMLDLWAAATYQKKILKGAVILSFIVLLGLVLYVPISITSLPDNYRKQISLLHTGIIDEIYGTSVRYEELTNSAVMGAADRAVKRPVLVHKSAFPYITAKSHLIVDNGSGTVLSEHSMNTTFAPASTTKLMSALVVRDIYDLDDFVAISEDCAQINSSKLWLPVDSRYTVKDMLYSLLVNSAGDAGCALATSKLNMTDFVNLMNEKAAALHMSNTNFTNPVGLDGEDGSHYSSAWDLYLLSQKVMEDPILRRIVRTKNYNFTDQEGDISVKLDNTNKLLWEIPGTIGIKTGTTSGAGEVLIYRYKDNDKDFTVIVMLSEDRFLDTKNLVNWVTSNYEWK
jgi:D-alanyl-D-alanine carboxypeptidase